MWPEQDEQKAPSEAMVEAACPACDAVHAIHDDLGGYKLQCDCGAWLRVPRADIAMQRPVAAAGDRLVMAAKEKALKARRMAEDALLLVAQKVEKRREAQVGDESGPDPLEQTTPPMRGEVVAPSARFAAKAPKKITRAQAKAIARAEAQALKAAEAHASWEARSLAALEPKTSLPVKATLGAARLTAKSVRGVTGFIFGRGLVPLTVITAVVGVQAAAHAAPRVLDEINEHNSLLDALRNVPEPLFAAGGAILLLVLGGLGRAMFSMKSGPETRKVPRAAHFLETGIGLAVIVGTISMWAQILPFLALGQPETSAAAARAAEQSGAMLPILLVGLAPAVLDELVFRGMLQGRLAAAWGPRLAVFGQALAATAAHGVFIASDTQSIAPLLIHGAGALYLGSLRRRSESIVPGIALHGGWSALTAGLLWA